jgi:hypothetical protein
MTGKPSPVRRRTAIDIAKTNINPYDPAELLQFYKDTAMTLAAYAELDGVEGLQFIPTPRGVLPREEIPGAGRLAASNDGPVGYFMRYAHQMGYDSKSLKVQEALEERTHLAHIEGWRAHERKVRKNKATRLQREALETGVDRHLELRAYIKGCDARIDRDIRSDPNPDSRDIAVEWPKVWLNGVPIPVEPVEE